MVIKPIKTYLHESYNAAANALILCSNACNLFGYLFGLGNHGFYGASKNRFVTLNPLMPNGAFNICCPRDCISRHNSRGAS